VIDKVEVRVPQGADFRPAFQFLARDFPHAHHCGYVRPGRFYTGVIDLRPFGLDAILHAGYKFRERKDHKLELLQTGKKSLREMASVISSVFDVAPAELPLMRADFASDLYGVPVLLLHSSLRVKYKRISDERGELDYEIVGDRKIEYLRFGKAPNCVRAYDKPAECKARWRDILKSVSPDADKPTFEQTFGFSEHTVLSRVERQAGGGRLPEQCNTFGKLYQADKFNPFANIEIVPAGIPLPDPSEYEPSETIKILGTDALIRRVGLQNARALLNRDGNAKRRLGPYMAYVESCRDSPKLSQEQIQETYRQSVLKQIGTDNNSAIDSTRGLSIGFPPCEATREDQGVLPPPRKDRRREAARVTLSGATEGNSPKGSTSPLG